VGISLFPRLRLNRIRMLGQTVLRGQRPFTAPAVQPPLEIGKRNRILVPAKIQRLGCEDDLNTTTRAYSLSHHRYRVRDLTSRKSLARASDSLARASRGRFLWSDCNHCLHARKSVLVELRSSLLVSVGSTCSCGPYSQAEAPRFWSTQ
jgi:hypothetical protein